MEKTPSKTPSKLLDVSPEKHEIPPDELELNASGISLNDNAEEDENLGVQFGSFNFAGKTISPVDGSVMLEELREMYSRAVVVLPYLKVARSKLPERDGKLKWENNLEEKHKRLQNLKRTIRGLHSQMLTDYYEFCLYKSISEMPAEFKRKLSHGEKVSTDEYRGYLKCFDVEEQD